MGTWTVQAAADAPSKPNVLVQTDADPTDMRFPIAVADNTSFKDLRLSVACKTISGKSRSMLACFLRRAMNDFAVLGTPASDIRLRSSFRSLSLLFDHSGLDFFFIAKPF